MSVPVKRHKWMKDDPSRCYDCTETRWEAHRYRRPCLPTRCADCGWQVLSSEPGVDSEQYMVHDEVWAAAEMRPDGGHLCIGCLEQRLGRELTWADFIPGVPINSLDPDYARFAWWYRTDRLFSRMTRGMPAAMFDGLFAKIEAWVAAS